MRVASGRSPAVIERTTTSCVVNSDSGSPPRHHELLDLGDGLGGIESLGAGLGAVHDGVAAVEPERVLERVQALAGHLVAAVGDPAIGLQEDRRTQVAVAVPPVARARGRAAETEDALPEP